MHRSYESWTSVNLGRPMEFLWFGWNGYPVLVFPTSMGRFFQYEDTGLVGRLAHKIDAGLLQLVCVDSVDSESWYNDSIEPALRGARHERYDAYLRDELVPYVQQRAQRHDVGVYDVRRFTDGYWDHTDYANSPADYVADLDDAAAARLRTVDWILATGEYDELAGDHRRFERVLTEKGIPHHGELWAGINGHDWPFWNDAVERLL
jgi:esterase/lipase superfamily enzyme